MIMQNNIDIYVELYRYIRFIPITILAISIIVDAWRFAVPTPGDVDDWGCSRRSKLENH